MESGSVKNVTLKTLTTDLMKLDVEDQIKFLESVRAYLCTDYTPYRYEYRACAIHLMEKFK